MLCFPFRWLLPAGLLLTIPSVQAQAERAGPAASPALQFRSVLEEYRKFDDQPVAPWSKANDAVGGIGGWRAYAREARQPEPNAGSAAPTAIGQGANGDSSRNMPGPYMGRGGKP